MLRADLAAEEALGGARAVGLGDARALVGHRDLDPGRRRPRRTAARVLPGGENFTALSTRLATACWISSRSP